MSTKQDPQSKWRQAHYDRWYADLMRLARAADRTAEVKSAADALFGALHREATLFRNGELGAVLEREQREKLGRLGLLERLSG